MSSRPQFNPYPVIVDGDMSGNLTSEVTIIQKLSMISYDVSWVGTLPIGDITIEVSNTYSQNADGSVKNPGNWTTLTLSAPTPVSGSPGNGFIDIDATAGYAIRLVYTRTSGTGTLNVMAVGKVQ
jgi:hypothetical protein